MTTIPCFDDLLAARERIQRHIHRTPVLTSRAIDAMCSAQLFFKCENLQRAGAFKMRGASNAVFSLDEERASRGVVTHSSGNHAAAMALAARERGIKAYVVMPHTAPAVKQAAVAGYGAEITLCEPTVESRQDECDAIADRTGATILPSFNHPDVIAGHGSVAFELHEDVPELDIVMAPVGGGGLLAGIAIAYRGFAPDTAVIGAEPEVANTAARSMSCGEIVPAGRPETVADGLRMTLGTLILPIYQQYVDAVLPVTEAGIVDAMRLIWERMKLVTEASSSVPLAAVFEHEDEFRGKRVGIVLSGGNIDLDRLPW